ncbi:MAG: potassium channel protein [Dehalococcoidia bacterium]
MSHARRLFISGSMLLALVCVGTLGFMVIERWSLLDALYQTVTTLSTVGFREVHPLSRPGMVFTMLVIVLGVGTLFYTLTAAVELAVQGELGEYFGRRRMQRRLGEMSGHYIVCGYGRVGREVAQEFKARRIPFVVVDTNPLMEAELRRLGYDYIEGNATDDDVLKAAGVEQAKGLLAAADADTDNTYIVLSARALNPHIFIVARAGQPSTEDKLRRAGADRIVSPYAIAGRHMAVAVMQPAMVDFMTTAFRTHEGELMLAELTATAASGLMGRSLRQVFGASRATTVLGVRRADGDLVVGPGPDVVLHAGDQIIVLGPETELESFSTRTGATVPADGQP